MKLLRLAAAFLLVALLVAPSIVAPLAAAQEDIGKPVTKIVFKTVTEQTAGIIEVAKGNADVFMWSQPLGNYKDVPPDLMNKLALIPAASTFYDLALNPASNIYDSKAPGEIPLKDGSIKGKLLPGLVYLDADKKLGKNWVDINEIDPNDDNIIFNPWGVQKMRLALEYLIDRSFIVDNILEGSANPMLTAIIPTHGAYPWVQDIPEGMGITATPDVEKAKQLFQEALDEVNQVLQQYGYQLYYKEEGGKKWLYLKYPDGHEKQVVVNFLIRVEDERLDIGRQVAQWIEDVFGIKVNKIERERSVVSPVVYGTNPIDTSDTLGGVMWSMYTEGWVSTTDDPAYYARYDAAFFYAPLRGYGPNHRVTNWWYIYDPQAYQLGYNLFFGSYTPQEKQKLINDIREMVKWGLEQSFRVFLTQNLEYFPVNKDRVKFMLYGSTSGLWSIWGLRTARTTDGTLTVLEYSSQGALFMSAWNPILGLNDVYSTMIWNQIRDFAMYNHPVTGMPVPIRATFDVKIGKTDVPVDALVYDPVEDKWITVGEAINKNKTYIPGIEDLIKNNGKAEAVVIFNYKLGKWHDGTPNNLAHILGNLAFDYEWAFNDTKVTGKPDPYYDPEIETAIGGNLANIFGIKIINNTAIAIYTPYVDVDPALIAASVDIWPTIPLHLLMAMEKAVVEDPGGTNYGWADREATGEVAIDMLKHADVIKKMAEELKGTKPKYLNGLNLPCNFDAALDNLIKFIDEYGHAVVSNGPFMVKSYDPTANVMELEAFEDYVFPTGYIPLKAFEGAEERHNYHGNLEAVKAEVEKLVAGQQPQPTTTSPATTTPATTASPTTTTPTTTPQKTQQPATTAPQATTPAGAGSPTQPTQPKAGGGVSTTAIAAIVVIIIIAAALALRRRS